MDTQSHPVTIIMNQDLRRKVDTYIAIYNNDPTINRKTKPRINRSLLIHEALIKLLKEKKQHG